MRTVETASGATAVQIVYSNRRGSRQIEHIGSAHDEQELAALKAAAASRLAAGQLHLDLGVATADGAGPLPITSARMAVLWECLDHVYAELGFGAAAKGDKVFRDLVLARIIEPTSKLDSLRVLEEVGVTASSYATVKRRLHTYAYTGWRKALAAACAAHAGLGPTTLVLYDVTTAVFRDRQGRRVPRTRILQRTPPGASDHGRAVDRCDRISVDGRSLRGQQSRDFDDDADADRLHECPSAHRCHRRRGRRDDLRSEQKAIEDAGLSFILGDKIPTIPYQVSKWHKNNPDSTPPDRLVLTQRSPANSKTSFRRDQVVYYQYSADRARRSLRGINEQVGKAEKAVAGKLPVKRNRFVTLKGADKSVNRELETKARTLAGWKAYATNIDSPTPQFVIGAYHQLRRIEKRFRMSKSDLAARPIFHHTPKIPSGRT